MIENILKTKKLPSRLSRINQNIGVNILNQVNLVAAQLILIPLFLNFWGSIKYGEWLTLSAIATYLVLLDFGMQTYVVNRFAEAYVQGRIDNLNHDFMSSLKTYFLIAGIVGVILITVSFSIPFHFEATKRWEVALILSLLGLDTLHRIPAGLIAGLYRASYQNARGALIANLQWILLNIITAAILVFKGPLWFLAFSRLVVGLLVITFIYFDLRKRLEDISWDIRKGQFSHGFKLLFHSSFLLIIMAADSINNQGLVLIISYFFKASAVSLLVTTRMFINFIRQFTMMLNYSISPEIPLLYATKNKEKFKIMFFGLMKTNLIVTSCGVICLKLIGQEIYQFWTGKKFVFDTFLFNLFLIKVFLMSIWDTCGLALTMTNQFRRYSFLKLINAIATILLGIWLVQSFGVSGVVLGAVIADGLILLFFVPRLTSKIFDISIHEFWQQVLLRGMPIILIGYGLSVWFESYSFTWYRYFILTFLVCLIFFGTSYFFWLNKVERNLGVEMVRKLKFW